jgi:uncharacterized membrane protein
MKNIQKRESLPFIQHRKESDYTNFHYPEPQTKGMNPLIFIIMFAVFSGMYYLIQLTVVTHKELLKNADNHTPLYLFMSAMTSGFFFLIYRGIKKGLL